VSIEVRRTKDLKLGQTVLFKNAELIADEEPAGGGDGAGPSPHDIYDGALGACKALTVMWYAARKKIPVQDIAVRVDRDASQERSGTYALATTLRIGGPLSDAQLEELRRVAEKCPIHKLMTAVTTTISTKVERMT
jgi:putative redox protein